MRFTLTFLQVNVRPPSLPDKEPDGEVFGKHDMNSDKMAERRKKAYSLLQEQKSLVDQRKRDAILARLAEQRQEEEMLKRAKNEYVLLSVCLLPLAEINFIFTINNSSITYSNYL